MDISQEAGKESTLSQNINSNNTINVYMSNDKDCVDSFVKQMQRNLDEGAEISKEVGQKNIQDFGGVFFSKLQNVGKEMEDVHQAFSDPGFQILLRKAQLTAACSGRENDYNILSELLIHRIKSQSDIKEKATISKAVEIINYIDEDSLFGLTITFLINNEKKLIKENLTIKDTLESLSTLYSLLDLTNLPTDWWDWKDNLSILGAITTHNLEWNTKKYEERIGEDKICVGIRKDSRNYEIASKIKGSLSLIDNELLDGYVRLAVSEQEKTEYSDEVRQILDLYEKNQTLLNQAKKKLKTMISAYEPLNQICEWKNKKGGMFELTSIGKVVAYANCRIIMPNFPSLDI